MSLLEQTFLETNEKYHEGCGLDDYNGQISICADKGGKDGKIYLRWCFPQNKDRKPSEKGLPWKVDLGSRERAIKILEAFVRVLKGEAKPERQQPQISETDYPF